MEVYGRNVDKAIVKKISLLGFVSVRHVPDIL